ncbi:pyridine nucleotide-disulphide oxidoreductase [Ureibacillus xyleni]|uniref:Pyridine nucleotide-disulphide oxidoreductase n=1 Tax=Ureibacillus xyleni TaxID=614648 RepID=A0A285S074_9BACL|nr:FAD-dependent oxidoreductase [Ureibacillus xyleni]SOB99875.1 pyridine nucleotide-disulphide oxidoreductase [Ureibacillus xyleni]
MFEVAIIGGGPAGGSAAIYTAKAGKKTIIIDSNQGVTKRAKLWNHYGVEEITGPNLVETGLNQAKKFGAEVVETKVTAIAKTEDGFTITTENGKFEAKQIILATGFLTDLAQSIGLATKDGTEPRVKTIFDVDATGKTNVKGIWAAGTCAGVSVHTIITAGDGAKVAINLISELNGERYVDHDVLK